MVKSLKLPMIDLSSLDLISTANAIRQACIDHGFFYLINHGVEEPLLQDVFDQSRKLFSLPLEDKMKLGHKGYVGFFPLHTQNLDPSNTSKGDSKETFHIGPLEDGEENLNIWPSEETLPSWRFIMEKYHRQVLYYFKLNELPKCPYGMCLVALLVSGLYLLSFWSLRCAGKRLASLIALALNLEEDFFEKEGALDKPFGFLRLLHYPGEMGVSDEVIYGSSAHSDFGMITLLATDGVPGLQVCREKLKQPRIWEDVYHVKGAFIVNLGDMMERWTNCLFRSTLHRVMPTGKDRYSMAFFLDPNQDCIVKCLKSCCSESSPPRFPPIRSGDYLRERFSAADLS